METSSGAVPDEGALPTWVPEAVARVAKQLLREPGPWSRDAICRLACDPRMRAVWTELQKSARKNHKKSGCAFHIPQDNALTILNAFVKYCDGNEDYWRRLGETKRADLSADDISFLRTLAPQQRACVLVFGFCVSAASLGFRIVTESEWKAESWDGPAPEPFIIERRRGDQIQKALAIGIGSALRNLFGTPFLRTTATLVGVIIDTKTPCPDLVREWLRNP